jgi:hypothetical protein
MATRLVAALTLQPFLKLDLADLRPSGLDQWFVLIALLLIVRVWFRMSTAMAMFATGVLLLPYLTLSGGPRDSPRWRDSTSCRSRCSSPPPSLARGRNGWRPRWSGCSAAFCSCTRRCSRNGNGRDDAAASSTGTGRGRINGLQNGLLQAQFRECSFPLVRRLRAPQFRS